MSLPISEANLQICDDRFAKVELPVGLLAQLPTSSFVDNSIFCSQALIYQCSTETSLNSRLQVSDFLKLLSSSPKTFQTPKKLPSSVVVGAGWVDGWVSGWWGSMYDDPTALIPYLLST